jgi:hypothetical protein
MGKIDREKALSRAAAAAAAAATKRISVILMFVH